MSTLEALAADIHGALAGRDRTVILYGKRTPASASLATAVVPRDPEGLGLDLSPDIGLRLADELETQHVTYELTVQADGQWDAVTCTDPGIGEDDDTVFWQRRALPESLDVSGVPESNRVEVQGEHRVDVAALVAGADVKVLRVRDVPEATGLAALGALTDLRQIELPPHMLPTAAPYLRDLPRLAVIRFPRRTPLADVVRYASLLEEPGGALEASLAITSGQVPGSAAAAPRKRRWFGFGR